MFYTFIYYFFTKTNLINLDQPWRRRVHLEECFLVSDPDDRYCAKTKHHLSIIVFKNNVHEVLINNETTT